MIVEGGCYCGAVRYRAEGEPMFSAQCHCRECQYISGGGPNYVLGMPEAGFAFTRGEPRGFTRSDLADPVTRFFCATCGTHLSTRTPRAAGVALIKAGTLDDPAVFGRPQMAIYTKEMQAFHVVPEGVRAYDGVP